MTRTDFSSGDTTILSLSSSPWTVIVGLDVGGGLCFSFRGNCVFAIEELRFGKWWWRNSSNEDFRRDGGAVPGGGFLGNR